VSSLPDSELQIRVLVADAMPMSCQLLAEGLCSTGQFGAATASTAERALELLAEERFDTLLVSPNFSGDHASGLSFVRQAHGLHPEIGVVALLDTMERPMVVEAFRAGARGILSRSDSLDTLCKCIACVHRGQVWAGAQELVYLLEALAEPLPVEGRSIPPSHQLSRREQEIAQLVAEGCSNRQISERLKLSEHTIKNYLFRVFEKLGVSTRVELTLYALNGGNFSRSEPPSSRPAAAARPEQAESKCSG
jgi:two-component system nitrate/nitrite response regulator NarL